MEYSALLTVLASAFGLQGLELDESGLCALEVNGHLVYISRLEQADAPCLLLTAPIGSLDGQDGALMQSLLASHLLPEGIQFAVLDEGLVVMTRLFSLTDIDGRYFLNAWGAALRPTWPIGRSACRTVLRAAPALPPLPPLAAMNRCAHEHA